MSYLYKCRIFELSFYEFSYLLNVVSLKCPISEMSYQCNVMFVCALETHFNKLDIFIQFYSSFLIAVR